MIQNIRVQGQRIRIRKIMTENQLYYSIAFGLVFVAVAIGIICVISKRALSFGIRKLIHRTRTQSVTACAKCDSPSVTGDQFCRKCGAPLLAASALTKAEGSPSEPAAAQRLRNLTTMRNQGLVSTEEFEAKRAEILAGV
jgi:hypothetical protein